jgi:hypothetical protein
MTAVRDIGETAGANKRKQHRLDARTACLFFLMILPLVLAGRVFALETTIDNNSNGGNAYNFLIGNSGGGATSGASSGNTLTINGSSVVVSGAAIGGYSASDAAASGNKVFFKDGLITNGWDNAYLYGGWNSGAGDAADNYVEWTGGTATGNIYGGYTTNAGTASGNSVTINGVGITHSGWILGAYSGSGLVKGNSVTLQNGTVENIFGGESGSGNVEWNGVTISGGTANGSIYGGATWGNGNVTDNSVMLQNGTVENIAGGYVGNSGSGNAEGNGVTISGGTANGSIYGGATWGNGNVTDNTVTLTGGDASSAVIVGGAAWCGGDAEDNAVTVSGGTVNNISGGAVSTGSARNNSVTVSGGVVGETVIGGQGDDADAVSGNTVTISGGSFTLPTATVIGGMNISGGGNVTNNTVTINADVTLDKISGGETSGSGAASGNKVEITGNTSTHLIYGGYSLSGDAMNNTVSITGGGVSQGNSTESGVFGGRSNSATGEATGNTVEIGGDAVIAVDVYGGYVTGSGPAAATGNTVTLSGNPTLSGALYGGKIYSGSGDDFSGNTLNVDNYAGTGTLSSVANFEKFNFILASGVKNGDTILTTGNLELGDGTKNSRVTGLSIAGGGAALRNGDEITLIASANTTTGAGKTLDSATFSGSHGALLNYDLQTLMDGDNLIARVMGAGITPRAKALSEGRAAGAAFLNTGGDLISESGMSNAWGRGPNNFSSFTFGAASYNNTRTETGSHVDVEGFSVMGGLAKDFQKASGRLTLGAFLEAGWGNYDGYNDFAGYSAINSSGDTNYYGLGIAARYDGNGDEKGRVYADGAVRFGKTETDFTSNLLDVTGNNARYDSDAAYFGAHFGFGYIKKLSNDSDLDLYTKLLWTRQGGDTVTLSTGDPVEFDAVDSFRWRMGLRYGKLASDARFKYYIGAAYEHEFDGDAAATTYGIYPIDAPSMEGGTGIGELGFTYRKSPADPFSLDLNLSGYTGQREGVSGRLEFNWDL